MIKVNDFRVGQRVVCVAAEHPSYRGRFPGFAPPEERQVYTVREIYLERYGEPRIGIRLVELAAPFVPTLSGPIELGWWEGDFKPLEERKTDISIFERLLEPSLPEI